MFSCFTSRIDDVNNDPLFTFAFASLELVYVDNVNILIISPSPIQHKEPARRPGRTLLMFRWSLKKSPSTAPSRLCNRASWTRSPKRLALSCPHQDSTNGKLKDLPLGLIRGTVEELQDSPWGKASQACLGLRRR
jgi:hypothetical protein